MEARPCWQKRGSSGKPEPPPKAADLAETAAAWLRLGLEYQPEVEEVPDAWVAASFQKKMAARAAAIPVEMTKAAARLELHSPCQKVKRQELSPDWNFEASLQAAWQRSIAAI